MIRDWPETEALTWNNICDKSKKKKYLNYVPKRQTLSKKLILSNAYRTKRDKLKKDIENFTNIPQPRSIKDAMTKIATLQANNDQLQSELERMQEVANLFIHNASMAGLTPKQLMAPLPKKHNQ